METRRSAGSHNPFPVDPADVPARAVCVVKRTLLRHQNSHPMDDDVARLLVAMLIAVLHQDAEGLDQAQDGLR